MRNIRQLYLFIYLFFTILILAGCNKTTTEPKPVKTVLTIQNKISEFGPSVGSAELSFDSSDPWNITFQNIKGAEGNDWFEIKPRSGKAGQGIVVTISVIANEKYEDRSFEIVLSNDKKLEEKWEITQARKNEKNPDNEFYYIGLKDKANVWTGTEYVYTNLYRGSYHPKIQVLNDYIYVTTISGVYRKSLASINNTNWELFAFKGEPILQFVRNGNSILAATYHRSSKALLLSEDNGKTYKEATPSIFLEKTWGDKYGIPLIFTLTQHPNDPNTLLMSVMSDKIFGVVRSKDFGKTWEVLKDYLHGYQEWFLGYNPHDVSNIFYTGESSVFEAILLSSFNDGVLWEENNKLNNNCFHHIAFHPTDPNKMICSGEYILFKSTDKGRTWKIINPIMTVECYFYKTIYDPYEPEIIYTSGATRIPDTHKFYVLRSSNGGKDWEIFFQTDLPGTGGVIDFDLYDNKLFLYTYTDGIYVLDTKKI